MKYQHKSSDFPEISSNTLVLNKRAANKRVFSGRPLTGVVVLSAVMISGCSTLSDNALYGKNGLVHDRSKEYQKVQPSSRLIIPTELNAKQTRDIMDVPRQGVASVSVIDGVKRPEYFYADSGSDTVNIKQSIKGKVVLVDAPIQEIWPKAQQFMEFNNLGISKVDPGQGTIASDWVVVKAEPTGVVNSWVKKLTFQNIKGDSKNKLQIKLKRDPKDLQRTVISMAHVSYGADQSVEAIDWEKESKNVSYKTDMLYELLRFMSKATNGTQGSGLLASTFKRSSKEGAVLFGRNANGKPALKVSGPIANAWRLVDNSLQANQIDVGTKDQVEKTFYLTFTSFKALQQEDDRSFLEWLHGDRGPLTFSSINFLGGESASKNQVAYSSKGQVESGKEVGISDPSHPANQEGFKVWLGGKVIYNFSKGFNKGFFNKDTNLYELTAGYQLKLTYRGKATYVTVLDKKGNEAAVEPAEQLLWRVKDSIPRV